MTTPRPYLSWSQLNTYEQSPERYYRQYVLGEELPRTEALDFGSRLAQALEDGQDTGDELLDRALIFLPTSKVREYPIEVTCATCPLFGKLDGFDPETLRIDEYKSGKTKWNQSKVDKHGQLTFYDLLVYLKYETQAKEIWLHHWDTDPQSKTYAQFNSFETTRDMSDLSDMLARIEVAWEGIKQLCA